jgi:glycerol-3-phosphate dehydrogenase
MAAPADLSPIPGTDTLWAELPFVAKTEQIRHLDDLLLRRVRIGLLTPYGGKAYLKRIRKLCRDVLPWDKQRWKKEVKSYLDLWIQSHALPVQRAKIMTERKIFSPKAIMAFVKYLYYKIRFTKSQHNA